MRKTITLFLIYAICLLTIACPSQKTLEDAMIESRRFATYANRGVEVTRSLFNGRIITLEQKDKIADAFILLGRGGIEFDNAVARLHAQYSSGNVPKDKLDVLFALFDSAVIDKLIKILTDLRVFGANNSYAEIISLLTTSVLLVAKAFKREKVVKLKLEALKI